MANARLQVTELDFDTIKNNLKSYLKQQSQFQDYDFEGAGLSVLLDLLAYNTHYNAYYLNMVANEAFLDTSLLRDSVVSHAKTLGYIPFSYNAPKAIINVTVETNSSNTGTLTLPKGFTFSSNLIDDVSYNFVTIEDTTVTKSNTQFVFENLNIYEGELVNYAFTYTQSSNPKSVFTLPDSNIDTNTIFVTVRDNTGNTATEVYNRVTDILDVDSTSNVYFLQEGKKGNFQIYFGDGVIGKQLIDGATVSVSYLVTKGDTANKADGFVTNSTIGGFTSIAIDVVDVAGGGSIRESVDSIKYSAQAQYATQNRLVTYKDYESYIKAKYPNIDSLSVWGGEENDPPVYGKVYIALKPKTNYFISETEKQRIINEIITPKAIVSVSAEIRDPEYLFLLLDVKVQYDSKKTTSSETLLREKIRSAILSYRDTFLNKFASKIIDSKIESAIDGAELNSIIGNELTLRVQKRFEPDLNISKSYNVNFSVPLYRGTITNKLTSTEFDVLDFNGVRRTVIFDEIPQSFSGISSIEVINPGTGYTTAPTVTITGDGIGAEAQAIIVNGSIQRIDVTTRGIDYSRAVVTITGGNGYGASASALIDAKIGTLRTVYYDTQAQRQIVNNNAGIINYETGEIIINNINILSVSSNDNLIRLTVESDEDIIESTRNTIIAIDDEDPTAIVVELIRI
jgi:hypothetical protein